MKQILKTVLILMISLGLMNTTSSQFKNNDSKVAIIKFETEIIDYGTIDQFADGSRLFTFTNEGNAPLVITDVKTSCGCTVPIFSKEPILPGETGELLIQYDTKRLGVFNKTITVISNSKDGNKLLKIKGNIIP